MSTIAGRLIGEHRECDDLFARAEEAAATRDPTTTTAALGRFVADMERHLRREEEVLFPEFEARTGHTQGPTEVMRNEHRQMRRLFADMSVSLQALDFDRLLGQCETLLMLMQQHNVKEEQILYPMADRVLADEVDDLDRRFEQI